MIGVSSHGIVATIPMTRVGDITCTYERYDGVGFERVEVGLVTDTLGRGIGAERSGTGAFRPEVSP